MTLKYLLDENVDPSYKTQLSRLNPDLIVWVVGEPHSPSRGTLDTEILLWCVELANLTSFVNNFAFRDCAVAAIIASGSLILYCLRSAIAIFYITLNSNYCNLS